MTQSYVKQAQEIVCTSLLGALTYVSFSFVWQKIIWNCTGSFGFCASQSHFKWLLEHKERQEVWKWTSFVDRKDYNIHWAVKETQYRMWEKRELDRTEEKRRHVWQNYHHHPSPTAKFYHFQPPPYPYPHPQRSHGARSPLDTGVLTSVPRFCARPDVACPPRVPASSHPRPVPLARRANIHFGIWSSHHTRCSTKNKTWKQPNKTKQNSEF